MSSGSDAPGLTNPYPGFRPFSAEEGHLFFGREKQTDELLERLGAQRLLAVVGVSGSGKSSLVRAGLLPTLHGGFIRSAGAHWRIGVMHPGNDPVGGLAGVVASMAAPGAPGEEAQGPEDTDEDRQLRHRLTEVTLRRGGLGLIDAVRHLHLPGGTNALVVVDQFEELFRFKRDREGAAGDDPAAALVRLILEATGQSDVPIFVVLTMRSDFLGQCAEFLDLAEAINRGQYLIPRMTRDEMRLAITGPARVAGGKLSERLVQTLMNEYGDDPARLPLLQHALMRTWDRASLDAARPSVDLDSYHDIGGIDLAIYMHAEEAFAELDAGQRVLCKRVFQGLTHRETDHGGIRRPTPFGELMEISSTDAGTLLEVLEPFRREGRSFLQPAAGTELTPASIVDIAHESLMSRWGRLDEWIDEEVGSVRIYRRLAETAELYGREEADLYRNPALQVALDWRRSHEPNDAWAKRYAGDFAAAMSFLDLSARTQAEAEAMAKVTRERDRRRIHVSSLASMAMVAAVVGGVVSLALYRTELAVEREWLEEMAHSQAQLVEGIAGFAEELAEDLTPEDEEAELLSAVEFFYEKHMEGFGDTGEFVLGRMAGGQLLVLRDSPALSDLTWEEVRDTLLARPMRAALSDSVRGTMIARDYRGRLVLAAYEPIDAFNWGMVAKVDLWELQTPFLWAGLIGGGVALMVVVLGAALMVKLNDPALKRMVTLSGLQDAGVRFTNT